MPDEVKEITEISEEEVADFIDEEDEVEEAEFEEEEVEQIPDESDEEPDEESEEPTFTLEQLRPYCAQLFGHGFHVLRGAVSAGFVPGDRPITKAEAAKGMERYLQMPVGSKET